MRTDPSQSSRFKKSDVWDSVDLSMQPFLRDDDNETSPWKLAKSFSGHERNRLFMRNNGNFKDATLVSGADVTADARGFALLDFNRDGWLDMVVSSPNSPRFRILENRIHQLAKPSETNHCKIRLVGANNSASSSSKWSSRDAVGAELIVTIGNDKRAFHNSLGEGLSSQNSSWIHVGIGAKEQIDQLEVRWPSGKTTRHESIVSGQRVTLFEQGPLKNEQNSR